MFKKGFTLAETLITLTVLGVLAAITIPTMMSDVTDRALSESIRTAKYKLTTSTEAMKAKGLIGPNYANTTAFVEELGKHYTIAKTCDSDHLTDCWPYSEVTLTDDTTYAVSDIKTGENFGKSSDWATNNVGIVSNDGTPMIMSFNTNCSYADPYEYSTWTMDNGKPVTTESTNCIAVMMDINGTKAPNKVGVDVLAFHIDSIGSACSGIELNGICFVASSAFKSSAMSLADCQQAVTDGVLGITNCSYDGDYWAGAVETCGGTNKIPSDTQLDALANELYGLSTCGALQCDGTLDYTKTQSLGLPSSGTFYLWSSDIFSSTISNIRLFNATYSHRSNDNRNDITPWTICIE